MKKVLYGWIVAGFALIMSISSCADYLNYDYIFKDEISMDTVFMKKDYTEQWLTQVYTRLLDGQNISVASKGFHPFNFISDDMYYGDRSWGYYYFKNAYYNEDNCQNWGVCYTGIREATVFIHNVDRNLEMTPEEILDSKGQARFLRGYFYWLLLRRYGPIPILPDDGLDFSLQYNELAVGRSTYEECAEYIAGEMALAACEMLPGRRNERNVARATQGAALAIRARAYLYAASPLFNGNNDAWAKQLVDHEGKPLIGEYKEELWAKAAAAAKDVMDLNVYDLYWAPFRTEGNQSFPQTVAPPPHPVYSNANWPDGWKNIDPFESYRSVFNGALTVTANPELIFSRGTNLGGGYECIQAMVLHQLPRSLGGWNTHGVTFKHASTYYMADGKDFYAYGKSDPTEGRPDYGYIEQGQEFEPGYRPLPAGVSEEYMYREPRFYASIAYNGSIWETENAPEDKHLRYSQVFYYRGSSGQNGMTSNEPDRWLLTGIGIKKFYHPSDYFTGPDRGNFDGQDKPDIDIRYAEVLLMYAEALNELTGSYTIPNYRGDAMISVSRNIEEMRKGIKPIRMRAGLIDYDDYEGVNIYGNADEFRKAVKRERQIELFAETHRYYDLRRWKDAEKEETQPVYGHNMLMTESQKDMFHRPVMISNLPTLFLDKMYLWPINHNELKKNPKLTQNPGWTTYD